MPSDRHEQLEKLAHDITARTEYLIGDLLEEAELDSDVNAAYVRTAVAGLLAGVTR